MRVRAYRDIKAGTLEFEFYLSDGDLTLLQRGDGSSLFARMPIIGAGGGAVFKVFAEPRGDQSEDRS
jgi:hypothetical protein